MPPAGGSRDDQGGRNGAGILDMLISKLKIESDNEARENMNYAYYRGIEDARGQNRSSDLQQRRQATVYSAQGNPLGSIMATSFGSAPVEPRAVRFVIPGTHYIVPSGQHRINHSSICHHFGAPRSRPEAHRIIHSSTCHHFGAPRSRSEAPRIWTSAPRSWYLEQPRQGTRSRDRSYSSRSRRREKQRAYDSESEESDYARRAAVPGYKKYPVFKTSDEYILQEANHYEVLGLTRKATYEEIKKAHDRLRLETHPDRHVQAPEGLAHWTKRFQEVILSYDVLRSEASRNWFDARLDRKEDVRKMPWMNCGKRAFEDRLFYAGANAKTAEARRREVVKAAAERERLGRGK